MTTNERALAEVRVELPARVEIGPLSLHPLREAACVDYLFSQLLSGRGGRIETVNLHHLWLCSRDQNFKDYCGRADLIVADGMPLVWASVLQGRPLPERVTGADLIWSICAAAAETKCSVFLVGGQPGTARTSSEVLAQHAPGLRVVGAACPQIDLVPAASDLSLLRDELDRAQPDIVFVGLPTLKTHYLISSCEQLLPHAWWVGVGATFSFVSGTLRRAPRWAQRAGLEWLHRLGQDPKRLARRYLLRCVPLAFSLLVRSALRRV